MIIELISRGDVLAKALEQAPGAGVGFVVAAFCPSIGRKIKAAYVAVTLKLAADIKAAEAKIVADGEAAIAKKV